MCVNSWQYLYIRYIHIYSVHCIHRAYISYFMSMAIWSLLTCKRALNYSEFIFTSLLTQYKWSVSEPPWIAFFSHKHHNIHFMFGITVLSNNNTHHNWLTFRPRSGGSLCFSQFKIFDTSSFFIVCTTLFIGPPTKFSKRGVWQDVNF